MKKIDRRNFIQTSAAGLAGLTFLGAGAVEVASPGRGKVVIDTVKLGNSGLKVPRVALGTGSIGGNQQSNQTRLGKENFVKMARHAWDRGIRFFDMADSYGSHATTSTYC